jgi:hypothetical protein
MIGADENAALLSAQRLLAAVHGSAEARIQLALDGAYVGLFEWNVVTNQSDRCSFHSVVPDDV